MQLPPSVTKLVDMLGTADAMVALYAPCGQILYANESYRRTFFLDREETPDWSTLMRRNHRHRRGPVVSSDDFEAWLSSSLSRRGKVPMLSIETDLYDGRWLWIVETTVRDGHILFVALDITRQRQSTRMVRQERDIALKIASTDPLTGVSNRAHVMKLLEDAITATRTTGDDAAAVAILDIDHFKQVNDRFGHMAGDEVLRDFARIIRAELRTCDGFGRIGGEEFLILFPGTTAAAAEPMIEHLRRRVADYVTIPARPGYRIGFSAGLTHLRPGDTVSTVYARTDEALYAAKQAGRGRMRLAG